MRIVENYIPKIDFILANTNIPVFNLEYSVGDYELCMYDIFALDLLEKFVKLSKPKSIRMYKICKEV